MQKRMFGMFGAMIAILVLVAAGVWTYAAEAEDEDEVAVTLEQVPAAVKATLEQESKGGSITKLIRETEEGILVYSADIVVDGKAFEVLVDTDGKVVKRESGEEEEKEEAEEAEENEAVERDGGWAKTFGEAKSDLGPTGRNPYFILEPGYVMTLKSKNGKVVLEITVLEETRVVDGVTTRVVEERESEDGKIIEIAANFFAISRKTGNAYYFGEESRDYKDGKVVSTAGSWESGKNGATWGMIMPATPTVGQRYYQEIAPSDKAMDRARVVGLSEKVKVPAGAFENCLETEESSAVERGRERKYYAPGIGILVDGDLKLTEYGFRK